jgi:hypothetical protein
MGPARCPCPDDARQVPHGLVQRLHCSIGGTRRTALAKRLACCYDCHAWRPHCLTSARVSAFVNDEVRPNESYS